MIDREKVIKGLEYCMEYFNCCDKCPYWDCGTNCTADLAHDALALLKEQEAVEPIRDDHGSYYCGACGKSCVGYADMNIMEVKRLQKYCSECGREVKWE